MNRLLLLFVLSGCASTTTSTFRQVAVRPAPASGPLVQQAPPSYPGQTYAPTGAGLYQPNTHRGQPVERTPSARILPSTNEPGVWAADGEPKASVTPMPGILLGLRLPLLLGLPERDAKDLVDQCVSSTLSGLHLLQQFRPGMLELLGGDELASKRRRCLAAHLYEECYHQVVNGTFRPPLAPMQTVVTPKPFRGYPDLLPPDGHQRPKDGWDQHQAESELEDLVDRECTPEVLARRAGRAIVEVVTEIAALRHAHND